MTRTPRGQWERRKDPPPEGTTSARGAPPSAAFFFLPHHATGVRYVTSAPRCSRRRVTCPGTARLGKVTRPGRGGGAPRLPWRRAGRGAGRGRHPQALPRFSSGRGCQHPWSCCRTTHPSVHGGGCESDRALRYELVFKKENNEHKPAPTFLCFTKRNFT